MATYATLKDMGIQNLNEIDRYTYYASQHTDHLRIVYKRHKGSLLPESHKYKFPRSNKTVMVDSGTRQTEIISESSQYLKNALTELDTIVSKHESVEAIKAALNEEFIHLEEEIAERIAHIKSLVASIK